MRHPNFSPKVDIPALQKNTQFRVTVTPKRGRLNPKGFFRLKTAGKNAPQPSGGIHPAPYL